MRAVQLVQWGAPVEVREIDDPQPNGTELLLRVDAAGLCLSDIHVMDTGAGVFDYPIPLTLGHEAAGTVIEVGPSADKSWLGRRVVVHGIWACRRCRNCVRGRENYCLRLARNPGAPLPRIGNGLGHHGGLAEKLLVPSDEVLVPTGDLDPALAAPLADAGLTAFHAIRMNHDLVDESTVAVVIGIGGLGHMAVQILSALDVASVIAVDKRPEARELASTLGCVAAHASVGEASEAVRSLGGADLVIDFAGAPSTVESAIGLLGPGGRLVVVGTAGGRVLVGKDLGLAQGWQVGAPFWGTRSDLTAVVELAASGRLSAETVEFALEDVPRAYELLRRGEVAGRAVVRPNG
ncbi:alcohol dehydrogenase catalytic domain-containing protein [Gordonia sp. KTR9]|uniref:alcohol dehydrogenase catalytic domain-containing protein n=1 Tax=Gordonia sp. KTR9 TaxID=337191 RepID=UPI00027DE8FD|nr:alcohol dehydrogenase catalytic domain-containing protein [Gordonia sp. KTR9]AFR51042.1 Zn-dependent alcohol dehydrogenase [Gordonia sp. KTR9]